MTDRSCERKDFLPEINRLRGIAILIVVVGHAMPVSRLTEWGPAAHSALQGSTWVFVFISGFLTAHLRKRYTYGSYLASKLANVLVPYILIVTMIVGFGLVRIPVENQALYYLLGYPTAGALWFVPMMLLFFLAFPLYAALADYRVALPGVAAAALVFAAVAGRPHPGAGPHLNFIYFQSAWLFGMLWWQNKALFDTLAKKYLPIVVLALLTAAAIGVGDQEHIRQTQIFTQLPLTILLMLALQEDSPIARFGEWLAPRSFGIFFLHGVITDRLSLLFGEHQPVLIGIGIGVALTVLCAFAVGAIQKLAGRRSRLLIGS